MMNESGNFQKDIDIIANNILTVIHSPIKILVEKNVEGIVSASILLKALLKKNVNFSLSFAKFLDDSIVKEVNLDPCKIVFLVGFNDDKLKLIEKKVFILSSSIVSLSEVISIKIDLPLPVISYLLAKQLDSSVEVSHLALLCNDNEILHDITKAALESKLISKFVSTLGIKIGIIKKEDIFLLNCEEANSPLSDIGEFSQFLEACIACDKPSVAVAKCLG